MFLRTTAIAASLDSRSGEAAERSMASMVKSRASFVCQACGATTSRWQGRCDSCGEWNTIVEELRDSGVGAGPKAVGLGRPAELVPLQGETESAARVVSGIAELDRVLGGGFVMGSAVLVGGDPGI